MKLPNYEKAVVSETKITGYLLSIKHREGRSKAEFFTQLGFTADAWEELVSALLRHVAENEVAKMEDSPFGKRYIVEGELFGSGGRKALFVRSGLSRQERIFQGLLRLIHCEGGFDDKSIRKCCADN